MSSQDRVPCYRLGVIGLGRLWEVRHRPALERLSDRFRVTVIHDQVAVKAEREAQRLGCAVGRGLRDLVESDDVDAVLLSTPLWFGLHPLIAACEVGKPVYCALPPAIPSVSLLDAIDEHVRRSGVLVMPEFARRFHPATVRLRELLATHLGPARLMLCQTRVMGFDRYGSPGPTTQMAPAALLVDPGMYLVDWCRSIVGADLVRTTRTGGTLVASPGTSDPDFEGVTAEFAGGAIARLTLLRFHRDAWGDPARQLNPPAIQVFAQRGVAWVDPPDRIQWTTAEGAHDERLPIEPTMGELLLTQFHEAMQSRSHPAPRWDDALAAMRWVAEARGASES